MSRRGCCSLGEVDRLNEWKKRLAVVAGCNAFRPLTVILSRYIFYYYIFLFFTLFTVSGQSANNNFTMRETPLPILVMRWAAAAAEARRRRRRESKSKYMRWSWFERSIVSSSTRHYQRRSNDHHDIYKLVTNYVYNRVFLFLEAFFGLCFLFSRWVTHGGPEKRVAKEGKVIEPISGDDFRISMHQFSRMLKFCLSSIVARI